MRLKRSLQFTLRAWRAMRGRDVLVLPQTSRRKLLLGNESAEWCICPDELTCQSVVYSFGVGEDISFDLELISRFGVVVHAFDPTPRAVDWLKSQKLPPQFIFHELGIAEFDGSATFNPPLNPKHVSYAVVARPGGNHASAVDAPVRTLRTIMSTLGHRQVDLLKMDIEGSEYGALRDIVQQRLPVKQLLVEFHHRWPEIGIAKTKEAIRILNEAGYQIFDVAPSGAEYSFLSVVSGENATSSQGFREEHHQ